MKPIFYYYSDKNIATSERKDLSLLLKNLVTKTTEMDLKKLYFQEWVYMTYIDNPEEVKKCLTKCSFNTGFELDIDKKWVIGKVLAAVNYKDKSYVTSLSKEDSSRRGVLNKLAIDVRDSVNKKTWLEKALKEKTNLSLKERLTIIYNLVPFAQRDLYYGFKQDSFFENIDKINLLPQRVQNAFAQTFSPLFCGDFAKNIPITEEQIKGSDWSFGVKKSLLKNLDREERCLKIKAISKEQTQAKAK